jgi:hypothetical protein
LFFPVGFSVNLALAPSTGFVHCVTSCLMFPSRSSVPLCMIRSVVVLLKTIGGRQKQVAVVASGCRSEQPFFNVLGLRMNDQHKNLQYQSSVHDRSLYYLKQLADGRDKSLWSPLGAEVNNFSSMSRNYGQKTGAS